MRHNSLSQCHSRPKKQKQKWVLKDRQLSKQDHPVEQPRMMGIAAPLAIDPWDPLNFESAATTHSGGTQESN